MRRNIDPGEDCHDFLRLLQQFRKADTESVLKFFLAWEAHPAAGTHGSQVMSMNVELFAKWKTLRSHLPCSKQKAGDESQ